MIFEKITS